MQADFKVINPDEIEMELRVTMSLKDWKQLNDQLSEAWPSYDLGREIASMVNQADRHFYPKDKDENLTED